MESQGFIIENEYFNKLKLGQNLQESIDKLENKISGIHKLRSKVKQEIYFLQKKDTDTLKKEHIVCSNLMHYEALVSKLLRTESPNSVLEVFHYNSKDGAKKIVIDIVSEKKTRWCKVIARNPKALSQISKGEGEYQRKSVLDHAVEFLECAQQNLILFSPPQVEFHFSCGVERNLAEELVENGIYVNGTIIDDDFLNEAQICNSLMPPIKCNPVSRVNLDVTAMIAYVSAVTNGHAHKKLRGNVLNQQAAWERQSPVKPVLDQFFEGMELYSCETAMNSFLTILNTLGGDGEKNRSAEFCSRITVVPDVPCISLKEGGQIKPRSLVIFGTGQALKAITVTSNSAFVRAANTQGIHLDTFIHQPRALTERKEIGDISE
ncbi:UPF0415 protein C7orf25 homolog isoform X2 [Rhodnius prolixus]|uniref:UPF0415 protein C7orf25 homolog isoform X2 n=1 Tax=Rhodnius prolixus TaxID=13249 RepID=UPI003D18E2E3